MLFRCNVCSRLLHPSKGTILCAVTKGSFIIWRSRYFVNFESNGRELIPALGDRDQADV